MFEINGVQNTPFIWITDLLELLNYFTSLMLQLFVFGCCGSSLERWVWDNDPTTARRHSILEQLNSESKTVNFSLIEEQRGHQFSNFETVFVKLDLEVQTEQFLQEIVFQCTHFHPNAVHLQPLNPYTATVYCQNEHCVVIVDISNPIYKILPLKRQPNPRFYK